MEIFFEIHSDLPREGPGDNNSTKKAFSYLKNLSTCPIILDVGCGPGVQTIELAKLSQGKIHAIDTHQPFLDDLERRAKVEGVLDRIEIINCSMFSLEFDKHFFDVIWSESAIYIYGFERGLKDWQIFLKKGGYFVVSEISWLKLNPPKELKDFWNREYPKIKSIEENIQIVENVGYKVIKYFKIPESAWWDNYYIPIERKVEVLREKYRNNVQVNKYLDEELKEIQMYRKYSSYYGSIFYVLKNE